MINIFNFENIFIKEMRLILGIGQVDGTQ